MVREDAANASTQAETGRHTVTRQKVAMEELRNGQVHGTLEEHARWLKGKGEEVWDEGTLEEHARWLRQEFAKEKKMREDEKRQEEKKQKQNEKKDKKREEKHEEKGQEEEKQRKEQKKEAKEKAKEEKKAEKEKRNKEEEAPRRSRAALLGALERGEVVRLFEPQA